MTSRALLLVLAALPLAGGCTDGGEPKPPVEGDDTAAPGNTSPVAAITSHADGDTVREGAPVTLVGTVSDGEAGADALRATWTVGGVEACASAAPAADGTTRCEVAFTPASGAVRLEVVDPDGATGTAELTLTVTATDAPEATLLAPVGAGSYYSDVPVALAARVSDTEDDATSLTVRWEDSVAGVLAGVAATPAADGTLAETVSFAEGMHTLSLVVTDTDGKEGRASVTFTVGGANALPACAITAPTTRDAVIAGVPVSFTGTAFDANVPADALLASWTSDLDGLLGGGPVGSDGRFDLEYAGLSVGTHTIRLTVTDEVGGACEQALTLTVGTVPEIFVVTPVDGDVYNDGEAIAFTATVGDGEDAPTDLLVSWQSDRDGVFDTTPPDTRGVVDFAATLSPGEHAIRVTVVDTDGFVAETALDLTVNALPTAPTVTIAPDPATTADDLVAGALGSVDPDGSGAVTYRYAWYVDGVLSGASTSATLPAAATTKDETWRVVVTPDDGTGSGEPGAAELTIVNTAPSLATPTLTASTVAVGDTLTCAASVTDADADAVSLAYAWTNGTTGAALGAGAAYTVGAADTAPGDALVCTVTADDGDGGVATASASATVQNSVPVLASVTVSPATGRVGDTFTCAATATDPDGGTPALAYAWMIGGAPAGTGATFAVTAASTNPGDVVTCSATATDADGGTKTGSAAATVLDTLPTAPTVSVTPAAPVEGVDALVCAASGATDADGQAVTYAATWTVDGAAYAGSTTAFPGDTIPASATNADELWTCTVTPTAGGADGPAASASVTIDAALDDLVVDGVARTLTAGTYAFDEVEVINGGVLVVSGSVRIDAESFYVDGASEVDGDGGGSAGGTTTSRTGSGTGGGTGSTDSGAGGGSHGGTGGTGGRDSGDSPGRGGATYGDTTSLSVDAGSGGGGTDQAVGGDGGGAFAVFATSILVEGDITMDGATGGGDSRSGGGGAGGGILLVGEAIEVSGSLSARGGAGGSGTTSANDGGGGGGGGRIKLFYETLSLTGAYSVAGGARGLYGETSATAGATGTYTATVRSFP